jgi:hypothetical protein
MQSPIRALLCGMGIWFVWVSLVVFSAQLLPTEVAGSALFVSMQMVALAAFVLGSTILYLRKVGEPRRCVERRSSLLARIRSIRCLRVSVRMNWKRSTSLPSLPAPGRANSWASSGRTSTSTGACCK